MECFLGFKSNPDETYPRGSDTRKEKYVTASMYLDAFCCVDLIECLCQGVVRIQ